MQSTDASNFEDVISAIKAKKYITVLSHMSPDSDAYGSSCGLALALGGLPNKEIWLCNVDAAIDSHAFLPGREFVKASLPSSDEWYSDQSLLVVLDCGDRKRIGDAWVPMLSRFPLVANVDHHNGNENFGHINVVLSERSSTCEIVFEIVQALPISVSRSVATNLMAGIVGDTGSFRYSKVTSRTFEIAGALVEAGANSERVATELFGSRPLEAVRLESLAIASMELLSNNRAAVMTVTADMLSETGASPSMTDGFAEKARDIHGVNVAALLRIDEGIWKVSMRSVSNSYDVSELARSFGGGGHKQAAAFRWFRGLDELKQKLVPALVSLVEESCS
jgi:bifunctional oligoribonuclease and PAP phosphatase NrnA